MSKLRNLYIPFFAFILFTSCQKEVSLDVVASGGTGGTGNTGGATGPNECNNTVMKLKQRASLFDGQYINLEWNLNGTIKMIKTNENLSEFRNITFIYKNDILKEGVIRENNSNNVYDTAVFHYNAQGLVDSMYLKNNNRFNRKITYAGGQPVKLTRYTGTEVMYYWTIQTDTNGSIKNGEEFWNKPSGMAKESAYKYSRDNRKNPFANLAQYMFYLDEEYMIFGLWGANNMIDQEYTDHTGTIGGSVITGYKYKYNNNCYPATSQQTIFGFTLFNNDDYNFIYY